MKTPQPVPATREATAHHEAGHAVVAVATGILCVDGAIEYGTDRTAFVPLAIKQDRIVAWRALGGNDAQYKELVATVVASGIEAEVRYLREAGCEVDERQLFFGAHGDVVKINELLGNGCWNQYREKACRVVSRPEIWNAICALAKIILSTWPSPVPAAQAYEIIKSIDPAAPLLEFELNNDPTDD